WFGEQDSFHFVDRNFVRIRTSHQNTPIRPSCWLSAIPKCARSVSSEGKRCYLKQSNMLVILVNREIYGLIFSDGNVGLGIALVNISNNKAAAISCDVGFVVAQQK